MPPCAGHLELPYFAAIRPNVRGVDMAGIVPPGYQPMVDWCTQPAPEFRGDTHALHFYLINAQPTLHETDRYMYHGYLFWKETPPRPRGVMEGFGRVIGNLAYAIHANEPAIEEPPKDWVRVSMSLTPHIAGVGVEFLDSGN